jgi:transcriptional regulator with XRE-family HTH domain
MPPAFPILFYLDKVQYYACMGSLNSKSPDELQQLLGQRLNALRLLRKMDQTTTAQKAGLSIRTIQYLEEGHGATISTLLRVLKALDALDGMELLAPKPAGKPVPLPRGPGARQRREQMGKQKDQGSKQKEQSA